jgi:hypothetical protein
VIGQRWIGYNDVESVPVYFYVQKGTNFHLTNTPISFKRVVNNVGNAMKINTGIFTAPVTGTYFFAVSGMVDFPFTDSSTRREIGLTFYSNGIDFGLVLSDEVGNTALLIIPHIFRDVQSSETGHLETYIIIYENRDVFSVSQIVSNNRPFSNKRLEFCRN